MAQEQIGKQLEALFAVPPLELRVLESMSVTGGEQRNTVQVEARLRLDNPSEGIAAIEQALGKIPGVQARGAQTLEQAANRLSEFGGENGLTAEELAAFARWKDAPQVHSMSRTDEPATLAFKFREENAADLASAARTNIESRMEMIREEIIQNASAVISTAQGLTEEEKQPRLEALKQLQVEVSEATYDGNYGTVKLRVGEPHRSERPDNDGKPPLTASAVFNEIMQGTDKIPAEGENILHQAVGTAGENWQEAVAFSTNKLKQPYLNSLAKTFEKTNPDLSAVLQDLAKHSDLQPQSSAKAKLHVESPTLQHPETYHATLVLPDGVTHEKFREALASVAPQQEEMQRANAITPKPSIQPRGDSYVKAAKAEAAQPKAVGVGV